MSYNIAYKYLYEHMTQPDEKIVTILEGLIRENNGLDMIINRNPKHTWARSIRNVNPS